MSKPIGKSAQGSEPRTTKDDPTREEIEVRAYEIYVERGGGHGQDVDDWLRAERELLEDYRTDGRRGKAAAG